MFHKLKENKLYKVLSLNASSVGISFVLGIFSSKVISFFLGTSGMALMGSFRNFSSMLKSVATLGINNLIVKLFIENKEDKKELSTIYSTLFWLFLSVSIVLTGATLVFATALSNFLFFTSAYVFPIRLFAILLPLMVVNVFWLAIYNGLEKFKSIIYIQIISNVVVFIVTNWFIWYNKTLGGLLSIAIGELAMVLITFLFIRREPSYFSFRLQKVVSKKYLKIIQKFSIMALLSAVLVPLTLVLIRIQIVSQLSLQQAGIWDGVNRLSGFYMMFFSSGLSLYYMPRLASLQSDSAFKLELKQYFTKFVPLFAMVLMGVFFAKDIVVRLAFTQEFSEINTLLIWQLLGDLFKIITLAFGFQIVVKTMMSQYIIGELLFNVSYLLLSYFLIINYSIKGVVFAYLLSNIINFIYVLLVFRKLFISKKEYNYQK